MAGVTLRGVKKSFRSTEVVHGVDLDVADGEFVVFVGPSGCGKSTLLRMIAGLEEVTAGTIAIGGRDVTRVDPSKRGTAMVFQTYALYPHMTVAANMGFPLEMAKRPKDEIAERVKEAARTLDLEPYLDRKPRELSGGQRQRVAIGRAIVREPSVFLFDEPLSNLDAELRVQTRLEIAKLRNALKATMIYVTHDQVEAMTLADRIVVLRAGRVEQIGRPLDLYEDPDNLFVAGFIGSPKMNFMAGAVSSTEGDKVVVSSPAFPGSKVAIRPRSKALAPGTKVTLGIRPEHIGAAGPEAPYLPVEVAVVERLGGLTFVHGRSADGHEITIDLRAPGVPAAGSSHNFGVSPEHVFIFAEDGRRL